MKTIIATLILAASLLTSNAYYSGAWYSTKAPTPASKTAGQIDFYFYDDGTVFVEVYLAGDVAEYGSGTWSNVRGRTNLRFTTSQGSTASGTMNRGLLSGTWKTADKRFSGKWQATLVEED
jgi:hypothetical protein